MLTWLALIVLWLFQDVPHSIWWNIQPFWTALIEITKKEVNVCLQNVHLMLIIIMYIYDAFIKALSAHIRHINLNMRFYTHIEHSPTKTIYIKYYTEKQTNTCSTHTHAHNDCSRNWALILVGAKILWFWFESISGVPRFWCSCRLSPFRW